MRYSKIYRICLFFNTIAYYPTNPLDMDAIFESLKCYLLRCISVVDANLLIKEYLYIQNNEKKINKVLSSKDSYKFDVNDVEYKMDIEFCSEEESIGNYIISTILSDNKKEPELLSSIDNELYSIIRKGNKFYIYEDYDYYLIHKDNKIVICKNDEKLMILSHQKKGIKVSSNTTNLDIVNIDEYLFKVIDKNSADKDDYLATIDIDSIDDLKERATSLIEIYVEDNEFILLLGLAALLLLQDMILHTKHMMYYVSSR